MIPYIGRYFDILNQSRKLYRYYLDPICKKWELTSNELDVMLFLQRNPQLDRAADIVTGRGMAKSHVSLSVSTLSDKGYMERHFSPTDRRTVHLRLTDAAAPIVREALQAQEAFFHVLHDGISPEELQVQHEIYLKICKNIQKKVNK